MGEYRPSDFHLTLFSKENSSSCSFLHSLGTKLFLVHKIFLFVNLTIHFQPPKKILDKGALRTKENYVKEN